VFRNEGIVRNIMHISVEAARAAIMNTVEPDIQEILQQFSDLRATFDSVVIILTLAKVTQMTDQVKSISKCLWIVIRLFTYT